MQVLARTLCMQFDGSYGVNSDIMVDKVITLCSAAITKSDSVIYLSNCVVLACEALSFTCSGGQVCICH